MNKGKWRMSHSEKRASQGPDDPPFTMTRSERNCDLSGCGKLLEEGEKKEQHEGEKEEEDDVKEE